MNKINGIKNKGLYLWLGKEAGIEYKACLYFYVLLFYYCCLLLTRHEYSASILHMAEMIFSAYIMGYIQVYLMRNFDESDRLGTYEWVCMLVCAGIYTALCWFLGWSMRSPAATGIFAAYILFAYICTNIVNRLKRDYDTKQLNDMLENYKNNGGNQDE